MDMIYELFEILKGMWSVICMLAGIAFDCIKAAIEFAAALLGI